MNPQLSRALIALLLVLWPQAGSLGVPESGAKLIAVSAQGEAIAPAVSKEVPGNVPVWATSKQAPVLIFKQLNGGRIGGPIYLRVKYLDRGYGRLMVNIKTAEGKWTKADKFTQVVLLDSGKWVTSFQRWNAPIASPLEVQVSLDKNKEIGICVSEVVQEEKEFADPHFRYVSEEGWKSGYTGPSLPGIENQTLKGKVMVGYQGWFRTPNDPYDNGWVHWGDMNRGAFSIDMWPDVSGYPTEALDKAAEVKLRSGKPAYLFSSGWPETVRLHFSWMRKNNIDGAFLQRFVNSGGYAINGRPEWVLGNVREAANREGRIWAIEYDVSGCPDEKLLEMIRKDWVWMIDEFGIRKDASYAHERGKLVVFVWGMGVGGRNITPKTANAVLDFLKNDPKYGGNYVIGGLPGNWRKLDPAWQEHISKHDGVLAWMSRNYAEDVADFRKLGLDYFPHVWPGFSWANLKHIPTGSLDAYTPRAGGQFYEGLLGKAMEGGVDRLFVGMLDEYDEGTAILPMSDDAPATPQRPGVSAQFFPGAFQWEGKHANTNPAQINHVLNGQSPAKEIPGSSFSVRFEGTILPPATGQYTFSLEGAAGDGAVLMVGTQRVKMDAIGSTGKNNLSVALTAGQSVVYRLDYKSLGTPGTIGLFWESPSIARELVPASAFVDAWGRFITNDGSRADWWLTLTGKWKKKLIESR